MTKYFMWLKYPLFWWVRILELGKENLELLDKESPILYVMQSRSFSDLLVLDHFCSEKKLQRPAFAQSIFSKIKQNSYLFIARLGLFQIVKADHSIQKTIKKFCHLQSTFKKDIQIVPISIIWGRGEIKEEDNSFLKLLFADDEHAGIFQKFLIILAQGRETVIHYGKPISLKQQIEVEKDYETLSRKIYRVMRVHFRHQRIATLGPRAYNRYKVVKDLFDSPEIQLAIDEEVNRTSSSRKRIEKKVMRYFKEIAAVQMHGVLKFLHRVLNYIWTKIYKGMVRFQQTSLINAAGKHEIIYVPSHRSHFDYLVMPYDLYEQGLKPPHVAAGINMSFWPVGPLLRRGGAFFLRRSFKGKRLYKAAFVEYLSYLMVKGHAFTFYLEGGRSRTGNLLKPKTGMLSMIVQNYIKKPVKPVLFVPVYIGYDRVAEIKSYIKELGGKSKKAESFWGLLKARKILKKNFGKVYIGYGKPLDLGEWVGSDMREQSVAEINALASEIMIRINSAVVVSPVALVSLALLSSPKRALMEGDLLMFCQLSLKMLSEELESEQLPTMDGFLEYVESVSDVKRFVSGKGEDVLYLDETDANKMKYYKNNITHVYLLPGLLLGLFKSQDELTKKEIVDNVSVLYPILAEEWFVGSHEIKCDRWLDKFVEEKVLRLEGGVYKRAEASKREFMILQIFAGIFPLESYAQVLCLLEGEPDEFNQSVFLEACFSLTQRLSILSGVKTSDYFNKIFIHSFLAQLVKHGYLRMDDKTVVKTELFKNIEFVSKTILSSDMWQTISRSH